jgi:hypothetical protein
MNRPLSVKALSCANPSLRGRPSVGAKAPARLSPRASPICAFAGAPRREARQTAPGGMAADRVARGREGADQILALDLAGKHRVCGAWACGVDPDTWFCAPGASSLLPLTQPHPSPGRLPRSRRPPTTAPACGRDWSRLHRSSAPIVRCRPGSASRLAPR